MIDNGQRERAFDCRPRAKADHRVADACGYETRRSSLACPRTRRSVLLPAAPILFDVEHDLSLDELPNHMLASAMYPGPDRANRTSEFRGDLLITQRLAVEQIKRSSLHCWQLRERQIDLLAEPNLGVPGVGDIGQRFTGR